jgi:phytoene dehydrogenase-like protein
MLSRRRFVLGAAATVGAAGAALAAPALVRLTRKAPRPLAGGFAEDWSARGHALREPAADSPPRHTERVPVVIVGGGIAGLSAAWQFERRGFRDFVVLELADEAGGNARGGENAVTRYPWAAHYVPVPGRESGLVRELFADLAVLRDGAWDERALCFAPQERLFLHGEWHAGLEPDFALPAWERAELRRFADLVAEHRATDEFTIPLAIGAGRATRGGRSAALDDRSAAAWLQDQGFRSPALRWHVEYGCRDDYGASLTSSSAWAALHYFAAREPADDGPLTWPEGNAWIVRRMLERLAPYVRTGVAVRRVARAGGHQLRVVAGDRAYLADAVIFAAPTFLAPLLVEGAREPPGIVYSPWLTANLTLERPPAERGAPLAWDNVLYDSPALGYVVATHQSLATHQDASVWTYYWALTDRAPAEARRLLAQRTWRDWVEAILADLERAHPDLRECVARVDVLRMGHAMARPTPGFLTAPGRARYADAPGPVFYANSDLSGLSLFEEAQYRGVLAADRARSWVER